MQLLCVFFGNPRVRALLISKVQEKDVTKPPKSTPHSDIDGVHSDERPNVDTALESGQDNEDVEHAAEESVGRPPRSEEEAGGKDGSG
jgi:hypothetical protein